MRDRLGIYIHIPFCVSKCSYCDFYSIAGGKQRMPDYQSALLSHISESAEAIESYEIDSIYIGGGTRAATAQSASSRSSTSSSASATCASTRR